MRVGFGPTWKWLKELLHEPSFHLELVILDFEIIVLTAQSWAWGVDIYLGFMGFYFGIYKEV